MGYPWRVDGVSTVGYQPSADGEVVDDPVSRGDPKYLTLQGAVVETVAEGTVLRHLR